MKVLLVLIGILLTVVVQAEGLVVGSVKEQVYRTAKTPLSPTETLDVPLFRRVVVMVPVYGPHPSCGYEKICNSNGCKTKMKSCTHLEPRIKLVFDHAEPFEITVSFPEDAKLYIGEKETVTLYYDRGEAGIMIADRKYKYHGKMAKRVPLDAGQATFSLQNKGRERITPPNTIGLKLSKEQGQPIEVSFIDVALPSLEFCPSVYEFEILERRKFLPDLLIARGSFEIDGDIATKTIVFDKDSEYLKDDRYFENDREYVVKVRLKRSSNLYNGKWSDEIKPYFLYLDVVDISLPPEL